MAYQIYGKKSNRAKVGVIVQRLFCRVSKSIVRGALGADFDTICICGDTVLRVYLVFDIISNSEYYKDFAMDDRQEQMML